MQKLGRAQNYKQMNGHMKNQFPICMNLKNMKNPIKYG
jgi:hypothetical protein